MYFLYFLKYSAVFICKNIESQVKDFMFRAVNQETESERKRAMFERQKIINLYLSSAKSLNIDRFFTLKVHFEQNLSLFEGGKSNLMYSVVNKTNLKKLDEISEKYNFLEFKNAFFEYIEKLVEEGQFVKAKKLLNVAKQRCWYNNEYFDCKRLIEEKYLLTDKLKKNPKFEDFL